MFKKELGISVYPEKSNFEKTEKYLKTANTCGFTKLFMSWFQLEKNQDTYQENVKLYKKVITAAKELGFYIVLDVHKPDFKFYQSLGVDCIRLDAPAWPYEIAKFTQAYDLDFQLNMSGDNLMHYVNMVMATDVVNENIYGCHNFYPQINTGTDWESFLKWNKHFNQLGIHTSTFINSQYGEDGPQNFKLKYGVVTVEDVRFLPIRTQAKLMFATKQIDAVYIGNQFASDEELKSLVGIDTKKIELDIELSRILQPLEKEILLADHHRREDINDNLIRSSEYRVTYYDREDIEIVEGSHSFIKGDVVITNKSDKNYQKELYLILKDSVVPNGQLIGKVKNYDLSLINFIKSARWFKFKIIE